MMVVSVLLFVLLIGICTGFMFFMFYCFMPALEASYAGVMDVLAPPHVSGERERDGADGSALRAVIVDDGAGAERRLRYCGLQSCAIVHAAYGPSVAGARACFGYGDCARVCPQDAICENGTGMLVVSDLCTGCGKCVGACPVSLISLVPEARVEKRRHQRFRFWYACYRMLTR